MESPVVRLLQKSRGEERAPGTVGSSANPLDNEIGRAGKNIREQLLKSLEIVLRTHNKRRNIYPRESIKSVAMHL